MKQIGTCRNTALCGMISLAEDDHRDPPGYGSLTGQLSGIFYFSKPLCFENKGVATCSIQLDSKNPILYIILFYYLLFFEYTRKMQNDLSWHVKGFKINGFRRIEFSKYLSVTLLGLHKETNRSISASGAGRRSCRSWDIREPASGGFAKPRWRSGIVNSKKMGLFETK